MKKYRSLGALLTVVLVVSLAVMSTVNWGSPAAQAQGQEDEHSLNASDGVPENVVYVDADGKVGIGTTNPSEKLDVIGTITANDMLIESDTAVTTISIDNTNTDQGGEQIIFGSVDDFVNSAGISVHGEDSSSSSNIMTMFNLKNGGSFLWITRPEVAPYYCMKITSDGNVGIGTTSPSAKLDVNGDIHATGSVYDSNNGSGSAGQILSSTGSGTDWIDPPSITIPDNVMIEGENISLLNNNSGYITDGNTHWDNTYGFITASSSNTLTNKSGNVSMWANNVGYITDGNTNWDNTYGFITASSSNALTNKSGNVSMWANNVGYITDGNTNWNNTYGFITNESDPHVGDNVINHVSKWNGSQLVEGTIYDNGTSVGIGTDNPNGRLQIQTAGWDEDIRIASNSYDYSSIIQSYDGLLFANLHNPGSDIHTDPWNDNLYSFRNMSDAHLLDIYKDGNVGIGLELGDIPEEKLDVNGAIKIRGGSDIAEPFDIASSEEVEPGMVVSIDPANPGKLMVCAKAYDTCVAGIVSGAGGINAGVIMGQPGSVADGEYPVALSGRVYCYADASNGAIQPGDLLTTSDTPGHAMKVTDYQSAQGAIIGKAMTSLEEGAGLVLVLVTLQ